MLIKNIPKAYKIQGINTINPNNTGNSTVQQKDINWSNRILGKEALTQIKIKIIIELFIPNVILYNIPVKEEPVKNSLSCMYPLEYVQLMSIT